MGNDFDMCAGVETATGLRRRWRSPRQPEIARPPLRNDDRAVYGVLDKRSDEGLEFCSG